MDDVFGTIVKAYQSLWRFKDYGTTLEIITPVATVNNMFVSVFTKTIARGAMTGSMQSPRTVKDFRHFRNVWNALSQGLVNFSTIRIF